MASKLKRIAGKRKAGAMIALAAGMRLRAGLEALQGGYTFDVRPRWALAEVGL